MSTFDKEIVRTPEEIDRVLTWAADQRDENKLGTPQYEFANGLTDMYHWLVGNLDEAPDE